jgi:serine/threonine protein kinase
MCARLNHPNIVQVLSVFEDDGIPFISMEYLEGQTLSELLRDRVAPCPLVLKLHVIAEVLEGLTYFHQLEDLDGSPLHPVHRDISPQNVMVTYEGAVKVLDFGIAKSSAPTAEATEQGVLKGKLAYMPREQIFGDGIDARVDLYAVGVMLWEAVACRRMWEGHSEGQLLSRVLAGDHPELPDSGEGKGTPALARVIANALGPRDARFATAAEMRAALMAAIAEIDPSPLGPRLREHMRQRYASERSQRQALIRDARMSPPGGSARWRVLAAPRLPDSAGAVVTAPAPGLVRRARRFQRAKLLGGLAALASIALVATLLGGRMMARPTQARAHPVIQGGVAALASSIPEVAARPCNPPVLADFEDGWAHLCAPGRAGRVIVYSDGTGVVTPHVGLYGPAAELDPPRSESRHAIHLVGKDLADWGAGMVVALDSGRPVDVSTSQGVAIWMRAEREPTTVLVEVATTDTLDASFGGACRPASTVICDDHYAAARTVSVFWTLVRVPFKQLHQLGFGMRADWNPAHVVEIHVAVKKDVLPEDARARPIGFDLWVDDMSLY